MRRWMEHTALTPVMQVYEDGTATAVDHATTRRRATRVRQATTLHQQLRALPARCSSARRPGRSGRRRPSARCRSRSRGIGATPPPSPSADDEYMLGPDLLVAPVVTPGETCRDVHLPPGHWVHWWSDAVVHEGPPTSRSSTRRSGSRRSTRGPGGLVPMLPEGTSTRSGGASSARRRHPRLAGQPRCARRAWASNASSVALDGRSRPSTVNRRTRRGHGLVGPGRDGTGTSPSTSTCANGPGRAGDRRGPLPGVRLLSPGAPLVAAASVSAVEEAPMHPAAWAAGTTGHVWLRFVGSGRAASIERADPAGVN